jgi:hypothetical protein
VCFLYLYVFLMARRCAKQYPQRVVFHARRSGFIRGQNKPLRSRLHSAISCHTSDPSGTFSNLESVLSPMLRGTGVSARSGLP